MQKSLVRKGLVLVIIVLFVGASIPLQGATISPKNIKNVQIHESLVPPDVKAGDIVFFEVYNYSHMLKRETLFFLKFITIPIIILDGIMLVFILGTTNLFMPVNI